MMQQQQPFQYGQMNGSNNSGAGYQQMPAGAAPYQQRQPRQTGGPRNTQISAEERCKNKIFVGGLSPTATKQNLEEYFSQFGTIIDSVVMCDPATQRSRGFGFVTFDSSEPLDAVQNSRPHTILEKEVDTKRAMPRDQVQQREETKESGNNKKVFVGGITSETTDDEFREYCSQFGDIDNIFVQRKGERHYGFCTFQDFDSADKMILQKDHKLNGSNIQVKKAVPKAKLNAANNSMNNSMGSYGAPYQQMAPGQMNYGAYPQGMPQMGANPWRQGNQAVQANQQARPAYPYAYANGGFQNPYMQQAQTGTANVYGRQQSTATAQPSQMQMSGYQYPSNPSYSSGSK